MKRYYFPKGGLLAQSHPLRDQARFTESYLYIPREVFSDIVVSFLPHWENTRAWIIARPLSGFAESFAHYVMEVEPGGGSTRPEPDDEAEAVIFVTDGVLELGMGDEIFMLEAGGYAYIPPGVQWHLKAAHLARFHWIRKRYEAIEGLGAPDMIIANDQDTAPEAMPDCDDVWSTTRFVPIDDLRHDMHVNIVNFKAGGRIPFDETHVMEHGIYVLEGRAKYHVNGDWIDVEAGDYLWLRAFCPQSCVASGEGMFRYLLYKDVNRHPKLAL